MGRKSTARDRIVHAATERFHRDGSQGASVAEICSAAEVQKGSFYHFFDSKRDVILAVIEQQRVHHAAFLDRVLDPDLAPHCQVEQMFQGLYAYHRDMQQELGVVLGCPTANLVSELADHDDAIRQALLVVWEAWENRLVQLLTVSDVDDAKVAAQRIIAYAEGAILLAKAHNRPAIILELAPGAQALLRGS